MSELLVSVVVATRNRPDRLTRLLDGLGGQTLDPSRFEVIVVADGASAGTQQMLGELGCGDGPELRVIAHAVPRGPAAARNSGWRAARAPVVAFIDDDCVPVAGWLEAGLEPARAGGFVQGPTRPDPAELDHVGVYSRTVEVSTSGPQYETCNIFYPRDMLESLGGFDEGYGLTPGGEDTDLGWRAIEAGFAPAWASEAVVYHAVERLGPSGMLRVAARWSSPMRVFADHPQARSMLYRGVFWNVWHYLLWRSVAALPAPGWLRRMILTMHLIALRRRARAEGGGTLAVPFLVLHDAVECWAVARGALRYRTLVL